MKRVRGGSGLGDSLYVRSVCEYFIRRGESVVACSDFPDVFIGSGVSVEPFRRNNVDVVAHYPGRNSEPTNQWVDCCISAGITEPLEHGFAWTVRNTALVERVQSSGRPVVLVAAPHPPMTRKDQFCTEVLPAQEAFRLVCEALADCFRVQIGGEALYAVPHDLDMVGTTSVSDLLDLAWVCDGMIGQCSYVIPLAEAFGKPLLCVWSGRVPMAREQYVRRLTPQKVLSKASSRFVVDDWPAEKIKEAARRFRDI